MASKNQVTDWDKFFTDINSAIYSCFQIKSSLNKNQFEFLKLRDFEKSVASNNITEEINSVRQVVNDVCKKNGAIKQIKIGLKCYRSEDLIKDCKSPQQKDGLVSRFIATQGLTTIVSSGNASYDLAGKSKVLLQQRLVTPGFEDYNVETIYTTIHESVHRMSSQAWRKACFKSSWSHPRDPNKRLSPLSHNTDEATTEILTRIIIDKLQETTSWVPNNFKMSSYDKEKNSLMNKLFEHKTQIFNFYKIGVFDFLAEAYFSDNNIKANEMIADICDWGH